MSIAAFTDTFQDKYLVALCKKSYQLRLIRYLKLILLAIIILCLAWLAFSFFRTNIQISNRTAIIENSINRILSASNQSTNQAKIDFDVQKIAEINLFGELRSSKPVIASKETELVDKNLEFNLVGTYQGLGEDLAIIIDNKTKEQEVFAPDQKIFDQALLLEVHSDHILINHLGEKKQIFIEEGGSSASSSSESSGGSRQTITVDKVKVEEALNNLPLLLTQARAVPYFKNGKSVGLRLFAIKKNSLFDDIQLKNGDILKDINGNSLADITQAVKLFEELKSKKAVSLNLERGKKAVAYDYQIN